ncbi:uncharacterized protein N7529_003187 [Penicillium soppii]|uniref:uncharacterized protein n=1 Tax=Penicillium soppii TaxID=69789 RepID=UPI002547583C|nr:uncharacterized protein N7529_003187 [Penicillium soppii]KAJ5874757.1 hypothetical protein N7529_003187 [Penicillium soppii]
MYLAIDNSIIILNGWQLGLACADLHFYNYTEVIGSTNVGHMPDLATARKKENDLDDKNERHKAMIEPVNASEMDSNPIISNAWHLPAQHRRPDARTTHKQCP